MAAPDSVILVHGSVETSCSPPYLKALQDAALAGYEAARTGGLLDCVEKTVMSLEDSPLFNAGYGSVLNLDGQAEMDAALMEGTSYRCGAVAGIKDVRNPVSVAKKVMEQTRHVFLSGEGATKFARQMGYPFYDPVTDAQRESWKQAIESMKQGENHNVSYYTGLPKACDTVGCVALFRGETAAAASTGGTFLKLPGRVGDSPVIGAGIYASPQGAAVCTGTGEDFIRLQAAAWAVNLVSQGVGVEDAAKATIRRLISINGLGGILITDNKGNVAAVHNAFRFPVALLRDGKIAEDFLPTRITNFKIKTNIPNH